MSDAEAIPGSTGGYSLYAYFKLARVQVKPGSNNNFRGFRAPVPNIYQALRQNADAEAMHGAGSPPLMDTYDN